MDFSEATMADKNDSKDSKTTTASAVAETAAAAPIKVWQDNDIVPRLDSAKAGEMILSAVQNFPTRLEPTIRIQECYNFALRQTLPAMAVGKFNFPMSSRHLFCLCIIVFLPTLLLFFFLAQLLPNEKHYAAKKHICVWFNADDGLTSGGRAVEIGWGPNYYTTFKELNSAIAAALDSEPTDDDDADDVSRPAADL